MAALNGYLLRRPFSACKKAAGLLPVSRKRSNYRRTTRTLAASPTSRPDVPVEDFFSHTSAPAPYDLWAQHALRTDRVLRELDAMQRQMDRDFEGAWARAEQLAQRAQQQHVEQGGGESAVRGGDGWQSYSRQHSRDEQGAGGYRRESYYESVTVLGPSQPSAVAQPPQHADLLSGLWLLLAAFLAGAWASTTCAFQRCYHLTNYSEGRRWQLLLLWPVLLLVSGSFRQQFWAALRGQRPGRQEGERAAAL